MRRIALGVLYSLSLVSSALGQDLVSKTVSADLETIDLGAAYWSDAPVLTVPLMAQPAINPKPSTTSVANIDVQSVHNRDWIAFRLRWPDSTKNEAGKLGEFSDALALMFPVGEAKDSPPPITMGSKEDPVHLFHWRAQYERDKEGGKPEMKDLYPNLSIDVYPMQYPDWGSYQEPSRDKKEAYNPGIAIGNPQSYKKSGVDEIYAQGFATSQVQEGHGSLAQSRHDPEKGWDLVITRRMNAEGGSVLKPGTKSFVTFAAWEGGQKEVGSRKAISMMWANLQLEK